MRERGQVENKKGRREEERERGKGQGSSREELSQSIICAIISCLGGWEGGERKGTARELWAGGEEA